MQWAGLEVFEEKKNKLKHKETHQFLSSQWTDFIAEQSSILNAGRELASGSNTVVNFQLYLYGIKTALYSYYTLSHF